MLVLVLMGWALNVMSQEGTPLASWNGQTSGEFTLDSDVTITDTVKLTGDLTINAGNAAHKIIKHYDGAMFYVGDYTLTITGTENAKITLDAGAVFEPEYDARRVDSLVTSYLVCGANIITPQAGRIIDCGEGNLYVEHAIFQNSTNGSAIYLHGGSASSRPICNVSHSVFRGIFHGYVLESDGHTNHGGGAAFHFGAKDLHQVTLSDSEIYWCDSERYGTVATQGNAGTILTIDNCYIHDNRGVLGSGIFWTASYVPEAKAFVIGNTRVCNNVADNGLDSLSYEGNGGGLYIEATMDITSATITGNTAFRGGGIALNSYRGGEQLYQGSGYNLTVTDGVTISDNTAVEWGGGVYFEIRTSPDVGFDPEDNPIDALYKFELDGGDIYGNQAVFGAGVCIDDHCPDYNIKKHSTTGDMIQSGTFTKIVNIKSGRVFGNRTIPASVGNTTAREIGGGICVLRRMWGNQFDYTHVGEINVNISGGEVFQNEVDNGDGGGIFILNDYDLSVYESECNVNVSDAAQLFGNMCSGNGAGIYLDKGSFTMTGGTIGKDGTTLVPGSSVYKSNKNISANNGGGFYVTDGTCTVQGGSIAYNETSANGGGFYVSGGQVEIKGGTISNNKADVNGGGFYVDVDDATIETKINSSVATTSISYNKAQNGGGAYINQGHLKIEDAATNITADTATMHGGGIYMNSGTVTVTNAMVQTNEATNGDGGGLYVGSGDITVSGAKVSGNSAANGKGGGIYAGNGNILVKDNAKIGTYSAKAGSGNTAKEGGGLYVNGGTVVFTGGTFAENYASEKGGGIYIKEGATLNLRETAELTGNHVPASGQGGGIYLDGTLNVGENADDPLGTHSLKVEDNYAGETTNLNNVYLHDIDDVIRLLSDISGKDSGGNYYSHIGFSVDMGFRPVIYAPTEHINWLAALMGSTSSLVGSIFDDSQKYIAIHVNEYSAPFEAEYIYLWACWTTAVTSHPGNEAIELQSDGYYHIKKKEGLAWFTSLVNGLNHRPDDPNSNPSEDPQPNLKAVLEADVDMREFLWVPIGGVGSYNAFDPSHMSSIFTAGGEYKGEFDGKGHIISGLDCRYITAIESYGLFGNMTGGEVRNTFVKDYNFVTQDNNITYRIGGIAGHMEAGVLRNCEAQGVVTASTCGGNTAVGGLVGLAETSATIHSSMAMPYIAQAKASISVGGLVGKIDGTDVSLKNSFSNAKFDSTVAHNVGGLVGDNSGTVENCYVRLQHETAPDNFYWFAAVNSGSIDSCYARHNAASDHYTTGTAAEASDKYGETSLFDDKYGYAHKDQDMETNEIFNGHIDNDGNLKGLLAALNKWVGDQPATGGYSKWTRTMASPMNGDYPILEFNDFVSAATTDNIFIAYRNNLDEMIDYANGNTGGGSVYLYGMTPEVSTSTHSNVRVYIAPNIGLTQATGNTINARVGITLDNSSEEFMAYDWHMFSPALTDAPMGLTYNSMVSNYPIWSNYNGNYLANGIPESVYSSSDINPPATQWNTTAGTIGYFPTNTPYGAPHDNSGCFDFYCYSEPYTHWVNFKREGTTTFYDHWRQNADENGNHQNIPYENETTMKRGKGYMVAIDKASMLMTDGTLDNNQVTVEVSNTTSLTGYEAPLKGVNLIGNPYQAYLDFNKIGNNLNTYFILDADAHGYIAYVSDGSTPDEPGVINTIAPQYLHPHQGFFVRVPQGTTTLILDNTMIEAGDGTAQNSTFRSAANHYPMVSLAVEDGRGRRDYTTVELDRPETGGGEKIQGLHAGDASLWVRHDDTDWQVAFTKPGTREVPVRFKAYQDGTFTLSWGAYNGYFSYLHLIDNLTGADIDCLQADEYRFEAKTSDYTSRFRLVFDFTGVEENDEPTEGPTSFAFMMGDELVINGEGVLQMFDLNGRQLFSTEIHGTQATVAMPKVADGIYVLRLTNGNQVRTQKMVINK